MNAMQLYKSQVHKILKQKDGNLNPSIRAKMAMGIKYKNPDGTTETLFERIQNARKISTVMQEKKKAWEEYENSKWYNKLTFYLKFKLKKYGQKARNSFELFRERMGRTKQGIN
jgi:hypothetical protein